MFILRVLIIPVLFFILSCNQNNKEESGPRRSLNLANIDSSVKPGDNFFLFANGKWFDTARIAAAESNAGNALEMYNFTKNHVKSILDSLSVSPNKPGSVEQKVGDFYAAGMDSVSIEKSGYDPVKPSLQKILEIKDVKGIMQFAAEQTTLNNNVLIGQYVNADEKNSSINIACYAQDGIGLPDRDYYFKTDPSTLAVVKAYKEYIQKLFTLTGDDTATAAKNMTGVYELEKQLAASHRTNVEVRDPQTNYNKMAVAGYRLERPAAKFISKG